MRSVINRYSGPLFILGLFLSGVLFADSATDFSQANQLLFFENHLKSIQSPTTLHYRFEKSGSMEQGFTDEIRVRIQELQKSGGKKVAIDYFSGTRARYIPEFENATGNPLLVVFLQRDVREMSRLTGGNWRHFQKMMKLALENSARVSSKTVEHDGKRLPAWEIMVTPYSDDKLLMQHKEFMEKYYRITLVDAVPGGIYSIHAVTPSADGANTPLVQETVTFSGSDANDRALAHRALPNSPGQESSQ